MHGSSPRHDPAVLVRCLEDIASLEEMNMSQTIRVTVLGEKRPPLTGLRQDLHNELSRIGNNLNQIAKVLNSTPLYQIPIPAGELLRLKNDLQLTRTNLNVLKVQLKR